MIVKLYKYFLKTIYCINNKKFPTADSSTITLLRLQHSYQAYFTSNMFKNLGFYVNNYTKYLNLFDIKY